MDHLLGENRLLHGKLQDVLSTVFEQRGHPVPARRRADNLFREASTIDGWPVGALPDAHRITMRGTLASLRSE